MHTQDIQNFKQATEFFVQGLQAAGLEQLGQRLMRFEAQNAVRFCINRYMSMCDTLSEQTNLDALANIFTTYAVWEGTGKYAPAFGRLQGRKQIREMFAKYMQAPAHFALNVHVLGNECIEVADSAQQAIGKWVLLQPSTFANGQSQLSCAKIVVHFVLDTDGIWRINHFQTERQFSRPMSEAWDSETDLPVPE